MSYKNITGITSACTNLSKYIPNTLLLENTENSFFLYALNYDGLNILLMLSIALKF